MYRMKKGYLKAVEALGEMILQMEEDIKYKNYELEVLKKKIQEMDVYKNENTFTKAN